MVTCIDHRNWSLELTLKVSSWVSGSWIFCQTKASQTKIQ